MTTPEKEIYPDTPIEEITVERIGELLDEQGLQYRFEDAPAPAAEDDQEPENIKVLRTGFINTVIAMQVRGDILVIDSMWRGQVPASEGSNLLSAINQWNAQHFAPTLRFFETAEHDLMVSAVRERNTAGGASRNQLGAFVMSTLNSVLEAFAFVEHTYPQLVTWQEPHND